MAASPMPRSDSTVVSAVELQAESPATSDRDGNEVTARAQGNYRNYQNLVARAVEVFGDELKASRWLSLPNPFLNGETPLETARKDNYRIDKIDPILIRIEHGIYL